MKKITVFSASILGLSIPLVAKAHCPLCTAGAIAIGIGAYKLGMSTESVGIGIGAFAVALGLWIARIIPRKYVPFQTHLIVLASFLSTILPVVPFMPSAFPIYIPYLGDYGITIAMSRLLVGSVIGGLVVMAAPALSRGLMNIRNGKKIPFQGMIVTLALLAIASVIIELT